MGILEIFVNTREDSGLWQTLDVVVLCSLVEWSAARHFLVSGRFFSTLPVSPRQLQEGDCPEEGEDQGAVVGRKPAGDDRARACRAARGGAAPRGQGPGSWALPCPVRVLGGQGCSWLRPVSTALRPQPCAPVSWERQGRMACVPSMVVPREDETTDQSRKGPGGRAAIQGRQPGWR